MHLDAEVIKKMSCGRTKGRSIMLNVSGRFSFECLVDRLREDKFSIMIGESTDKSSIKPLAVVTRMFVKNTVQDEFLCTKEVKIADTEHLYILIVNYFNDNEIPYKVNGIGFGSDSASVMMVKHCSVSVN